MTIVPRDGESAVDLDFRRSDIERNSEGVDGVLPRIGVSALGAKTIVTKPDVMEPAGPTIIPADHDLVIVRYS